MRLKLSMCLNDFLDQSLTVQSDVLADIVVIVCGVTSPLLQVALLAAPRGAALVLARGRRMTQDHHLGALQPAGSCLGTFWLWYSRFA